MDLGGGLECQIRKVGMRRVESVANRSLKFKGVQGYVIRKVKQS